LDSSCECRDTKDQRKKLKRLATFHRKVKRKKQKKTIAKGLEVPDSRGVEAKTLSFRQQSGD